MDIETAKVAADVAAKIDALSALMSMIDTAIKESWQIAVLKVMAPDVGSIYPGGTTIDVVLPGHRASPENSALALSTAQATYQAQHDALVAQLAAL